ncbi:MAG: hypothetical protein LDL44_00250 [Caenispirillum sp.]|nr:hypothetical protein [Caenispirillum sp.]
MTHVSGIDEDARELVEHLTARVAQAEGDWARVQHEVAQAMSQIDTMLALLPRCHRRRWRREIKRRFRGFDQTRREHEAAVERARKGIATGYLPEVHDEAAALIAEALKEQ